MEKISGHPLPYWVERMTVNFLISEGGAVKPKLAGYDLTWPDGLTMKDVAFSRQEADKHSMSYLSLEEPRVRGLVSRLPLAVAGQPVAKVRLKGLPQEISGYWSLWRISLMVENMREVRVLPLFEHEKDGKILIPTARRIWDLLLQEETSLEIQGYITGEKSEEIFEKLQKQAVRYGHNLFLELKNQYEEHLQKEREKGQYAFQIRRQAIMRVGLPAVRQHRLAELERQEKEWTLRLQQKEKILPELSAITIIYVEGA